MAKKQNLPTEKIVYSYDRDTKEYTGEYKCQPDPMKVGSFLIPANATDSQPPETHDRETVCFIDGAWVKQSDYRGMNIIYLETQVVEQIKMIGELPDGSALLTSDNLSELTSGKRARLDDDGNLEFYTPPPTIAEQIATMESELSGTDWYVVRWSETGEPVPENITTRRAELREQISALRSKES